jgi:Pyruvate/2-oxoacid:ferredoxin oxidoreductase delta subunit
MIDLDPEFVPTTYYGMEVGMGTYIESEIELLGDDINQFAIKDFDVVKKPIESVDKKGIAKFASRLILPRPYIEEDKCVQCGVCVLMCPVTPKAVHWSEIKDSKGEMIENKNVAPVYSYDRCIRCYCCQELCPESIIKIKVPLLRRILGSKSVEK